MWILKAFCAETTLSSFHFLAPMSGNTFIFWSKDFVPLFCFLKAVCILFILKGQLFVAVVEMTLGMLHPTLDYRCLSLALFPIRLPAGRQQMIAQVLGSLPLSCKSWTRFEHLALTWPVPAIVGIWGVNQRCRDLSLSVSIYLCLSNKYKKK